MHVIGRSGDRDGLGRRSANLLEGQVGEASETVGGLYPLEAGRLVRIAPTFRTGKAHERPSSRLRLCERGEGRARV